MTENIIDYTVEEQILLDKCFMSYKVAFSPDGKLDIKDVKVIVAALDYSHVKAIHIKNPRDHVLMFSILDKNGIKQETPQARQARLKTERQEKIAQMNIERIAEQEEEAKKQVAIITKQKEDALKRVDLAKQEQAALSVREQSSLKRAEEAEAAVKQLSAQFESFKAEMLNSKEIKDTKEVVKKLEKAEPAVVKDAKAVNKTIPIEDNPVEEKSIQELMDEINK